MYEAMAPESDVTATQDPRQDAQAIIAAAERVRALVPRAAGALDAGDVDAFAAVLAECDAIDDRLRRYQARLLCIEQALAGRRAAPPTVARTMFTSLRALVGWLEEEPAEPTFLQYAGVLAIELGAYRDAETLLDAVLRLEPDWPQSSESRTIARKRRKTKAVVPALPADVARGLKALATRIQKVAAAAKPAEGQTVGVAMIVRDEEEMLPRTLAAVVDGVDEIVIVDTGSRDRTVEIAESFGARVLHHEWSGDFSEARNIALDALTTDWVLVIDADEVLVGDDALQLRRLAGHTWREAFYVTEFNHTGSMDDGVGVSHNTVRMWRHVPSRRYTGLVHEQINHTFPGFLPDRFGTDVLRMDHFGYVGEVREERDKQSRNLPLLFQQQADGDDSPFLHFNIGSEYLMMGERDKALEYLEEAWKRSIDDPYIPNQGFFPSLAKRYIAELAHHGRFDEMEEAAEWVHARFPKFTDVLFDQAQAAEVQGNRVLARERFQRCLEWGDGAARLVSTEGAGGFLAELQLARLDAADGDLDSALERLRRVRAANPKLLGVIDPLASVLLISGVAPDNVVAELTDPSAELSPSGWFMLAVNLQERGHLDAAERAFRGAIERRPTLDHARIGLADALLVQGRIEEAVEEAQRVPADGKHGAAAVRTALFGLLAMDAGERLAERRNEQLALLDQTRLDEADKAVLRAWAAVRAGEAPPEGLGIPEVNALTPVLGALLRLGAADAFADLVDVLGATGVEQRTQREILATIFLSHQQTDLAAEQWIAAVQESGPDAEAYAGLADVARLQGMPDDAETMARESLALDPRNGLARRVLTALGAEVPDQEPEPEPAT